MEVKFCFSRSHCGGHFRLIADSLLAVWELHEWMGVRWICLVNYVLLGREHIGS